MFARPREHIQRWHPLPDLNWWVIHGSFYYLLIRFIFSSSESMKSSLLFLIPSAARANCQPRAILQFLNQYLLKSSPLVGPLSSMPAYISIPFLKLSLSVLILYLFVLFVFCCFQNWKIINRFQMSFDSWKFFTSLFFFFNSRTVKSWSKNLVKTIKSSSRFRHILLYFFSLSI